MNNILLHNALRLMEKQVAADMADTLDILINGYRCVDNCYLLRRKQCRKHKECNWDLASNFYKTPDD